MTPEAAMLVYIAAAMLIIWAVRRKDPIPAPPPEPLPEGKVPGFTLRIEMREPLEPDVAHGYAQGAIDHLMATFNDDDSILYITYDLPEEGLPE